ncbi:MAG: zf-HC2 domain-containing protein [Candidatus Aureabacteria bacterium]|nr:zf-HC2 domain-containing protein [Candidatus Auribacterota bacterium]
MCDKEKLVDLAWGEIGGEEAEKLLKHLASCPDCRAEYDKITAVRKLFLGRRKADAPAGYFESLSGRVLGRIKGREHTPLSVKSGKAGNIFFLRAERIAVVAAAACIFIIAGYYFAHNEKVLRQNVPEDKSDMIELAKSLSGAEAENEDFDFSPAGKLKGSSGFYTRRESTKLVMADIESKPVLERKDRLRQAVDEKAPVFLNLPELGMRIQEVDGYGAGEGTVFLIVEDIDEASKAYNQGIRRGDKIIKLQGREASSINDIRNVYDRIDSGVYEVETDRGSYVIQN